MSCVCFFTFAVTRIRDMSARFFLFAFQKFAGIVDRRGLVSVMYSDNAKSGLEIVCVKRKLERSVAYAMVLTLPILRAGVGETSWLGPTNSPY